MNEELLKILFEKGDYANKGVNYDKFKVDIQSPEVQELVYNKLGYSTKGIKLEKFRSDLGVGQPGLNPSVNNQINSYLAELESNNDYTAMNPNTSATGKYQHMWSQHKKTIYNLTGIASQQEYLRNPQAQEKVQQHFNQEYLKNLPELRQRANAIGANFSDEELIYLNHHSGLGGARNYLEGKYVADHAGLEGRLMYGREKGFTKALEKQQAQLINTQLGQDQAAAKALDQEAVDIVEKKNKEKYSKLNLWEKGMESINRKGVWGSLVDLGVGAFNSNVTVEQLSLYPTDAEKKEAKKQLLHTDKYRNLWNTKEDVAKLLDGSISKDPKEHLKIANDLQKDLQEDINTNAGIFDAFSGHDYKTENGVEMVNLTPLNPLLQKTQGLPDVWVPLDQVKNLTTHPLAEKITSTTGKRLLNEKLNSIQADLTKRDRYIKENIVDKEVDFVNVLENSIKNIQQKLESKYPKNQQGQLEIDPRDPLAIRYQQEIEQYNTTVEGLKQYDPEVKMDMLFNTNRKARVQALDNDYKNLNFWEKAGNSILYRSTDAAKKLYNMPRSAGQLAQAGTNLIFDTDFGVTGQISDAYDDNKLQTTAASKAVRKTFELKDGRKIEFGSDGSLLGLLDNNDYSIDISKEELETLAKNTGADYSKASFDANIGGVASGVGELVSDLPLMFIGSGAVSGALKAISKTSTIGRYAAVAKTANSLAASDRLRSFSGAYAAFYDQITEGAIKEGGLTTGREIAASGILKTGLEATIEMINPLEGKLLSGKLWDNLSTSQVKEFTKRALAGEPPSSIIQDIVKQSAGAFTGQKAINAVKGLVNTAGQGGAEAFEEVLAAIAEPEIVNRILNNWIDTSYKTTTNIQEISEGALVGFAGGFALGGGMNILQGTRNDTKDGVLKNSIRASLQHADLFNSTLTDLFEGKKQKITEEFANNPDKLKENLELLETSFKKVTDRHKSAKSIVDSKGVFKGSDIDGFIPSQSMQTAYSNAAFMKAFFDGIDVTEKQGLEEVRDYYDSLIDDLDLFKKNRYNGFISVDSVNTSLAKEDKLDNKKLKESLPKIRETIQNKISSLEKAKISEPLKLKAIQAEIGLEISRIKNEKPSETTKQKVEEVKTVIDEQKQQEKKAQEVTKAHAVISGLLPKTAVDPAVLEEELNIINNQSNDLIKDARETQNFEFVDKKLQELKENKYVDNYNYLITEKQKLQNEIIDVEKERAATSPIDFTTEGTVIDSMTARYNNNPNLKKLEESAFDQLYNEQFGNGDNIVPPNQNLLQKMQNPDYRTAALSHFSNTTAPVAIGEKSIEVPQNKSVETVIIPEGLVPPSISDEQLKSEFSNIDDELPEVFNKAGDIIEEEKQDNINKLIESVSEVVGYPLNYTNNQTKYKITFENGTSEVYTFFKDSDGVRKYYKDDISTAKKAISPYIQNFPNAKYVEAIYSNDAIDGKALEKTLNIFKEGDPLYYEITTFGKEIAVKVTVFILDNKIVSSDTKNAVKSSIAYLTTKGDMMKAIQKSIGDGTHKVGDLISGSFTKKVIPTVEVNFISGEPGVKRNITVEELQELIINDSIGIIEVPAGSGGRNGGDVAKDAFIKTTQNGGTELINISDIERIMNNKSSTEIKYYHVGSIVIKINNKWYKLDTVRVENNALNRNRVISTLAKLIESYNLEQAEKTKESPNQDIITQEIDKRNKLVNTLIGLDPRSSIPAFQNRDATSKIDASINFIGQKSLLDNLKNTSKEVYNQVTKVIELWKRGEDISELEDYKKNKDSFFDEYFSYEDVKGISYLKVVSHGAAGKAFLYKGERYPIEEDANNESILIEEILKTRSQVLSRQLTTTATPEQLQHVASLLVTPIAESKINGITSLPVNMKINTSPVKETVTPTEVKVDEDQLDIEAKKADIERRKQALRDLMKATGDDIFMLGVEDGTFMGEALLNMNENGDVILTRYADSEEGLTKGKGKTKNLKDIAGQFGGEQIATSGIEGGAASFVNGVVGEYHIPLQELIDLIKSEDVVFAGLGNKEFVLSPHIADKYLTKINGKQINAKYDAELATLEDTPSTETIVPKASDTITPGEKVITKGKKDRLKVSDTVTETQETEEVLNYLKDRFSEISVKIDDDALKNIAKVYKLGDNSVRGAFQNATVTLASNSSTKVAKHEAFHVLFNLFLTDDQRENTLREAFNTYGKELGINKGEFERALQATKDKDAKLKTEAKDFYDSLEPLTRLEEKLSEVYEDYDSNLTVSWIYKNKTKYPKLYNIVNSIYKFVNDTYYKIKSVFGGKNSIEDLFYQLDRNIYGRNLVGKRRKSIKDVFNRNLSNLQDDTKFKIDINGWSNDNIRQFSDFIVRDLFDLYLKTNYNTVFLNHAVENLAEGRTALDLFNDFSKNINLYTDKWIEDNPDADADLINLIKDTYSGTNSRIEFQKAVDKSFKSYRNVVLEQTEEDELENSDDDTTDSDTSEQSPQNDGRPDDEIGGEQYNKLKIVDPSNKISKRLMELLANTREVTLDEEDGEKFFSGAHISNTGQTVYLSPNEAKNILIEKLANSTLDNFHTKLNTVTKEYPWMQYIVKQALGDIEYAKRQADGIVVEFKEEDLFNSDLPGHWVLTSLFSNIATNRVNDPKYTEYDRDQEGNIISVNLHRLRPENKNAKIIDKINNSLSGITSVRYKSYLKTIEKTIEDLSVSNLTELFTLLNINITNENIAGLIDNEKQSLIRVINNFYKELPKEVVIKNGIVELIQVKPIVIRPLATLIEPYVSEIGAISYTNVKNKKEYAHTPSNYFVRQIDKLKDNVTKWLDSKRIHVTKEGKAVDILFIGQLPFLKDIERLSPTIIDKYLDLQPDGYIKPKNKIGKEYTEYSPKEMKASAINTYFASNRVPGYQSNTVLFKQFVMPTLADAPQRLFFNLPVFNLESEISGNPSPIVEKIYETILAEHNRVYHAKNQIKNKKGVFDAYKYQSFTKYHMFPFLNELVEKKIIEENWVSNPDHVLVVKNTLNEYLENSFTEFTKSLEKDNLGEIVNGVGFVPNTKELYKPSGSVYNQDLKEYYYNQFYYNSNIIPLFSGDPAFYKLKNGSAAIEIGKRIKQINSPYTPGLTPANKKLSFITLKEKKVRTNPSVLAAISKLFMDEKQRRHVLNNFGFKEVEKATENTIEYEGKFYESTKENDISDAAAFHNLDRRMEIMKNSSKWNEAEHGKLFEALKNGTATAAQLQKVLQGVKPFAFGNEVNIINSDDSDNMMGMIEPIQLKDAEFLLVPQYAYMQKDGSMKKPVSIGDINDNYFNKDLAKILWLMDNTEANLVLFETASKASNRNLIDLDTVGSSEEVLTRELNYEFIGNQVDTPAKHEDKMVLVGTQVIKSLTANLSKKYQDKADEFIMTLAFDLRDATRETRNKLYSKGEDGKFKVDMNKVAKFLYDQKIDKNDAIEVLKELELHLDGDFVVPLELTGKTNESLFNSIYKKASKLKTPGVSLINKAGVGFDDKLKMVFNEDGSLAYYEAYMSPYSKKFHKFADANGNIDITKIPEPLLRTFLYRIPTEDKYSMVPVKIVGFLPGSVGGAIVLPPEITTIAGLDFDVDKVYGMVRDFTVKDDQITVTESNMSTAAGRANKRMDLIEEITSSKEFAKDLLYGGSKSNLAAKARSKQLIDNRSVADPSLQTDFAIRNTVGARMIGIFASINAFHNLIYNSNKAYLKLVNPFKISINSTTYDVQEISTSNDTTGIDGKAKLSISKGLSEPLFASTEDIKDPVLQVLNLNEVTAGIFTTLIMLNVDFNDAVDYINTPEFSEISSIAVNDNSNILSVAGQELQFLTKMEDKSSETVRRINYLSEIVNLSKIAQDLLNISQAIKVDNYNIGPDLTVVDEKIQQIKKLPTQIKTIDGLENILPKIIEVGEKNDKYRVDFKNSGKLELINQFAHLLVEEVNQLSTLFNYLDPRFEKVRSLFRNSTDNNRLYDSQIRAINHGVYDMIIQEELFGNNPIKYYELLFGLPHKFINSVFNSKNPINKHFEIRPTNNNTFYLLSLRSNFQLTSEKLSEIKSDIEDSLITDPEITNDLIEYIFILGTQFKSDSMFKVIPAAYFNTEKGNAVRSAIKNAPKIIDGREGVFFDKILKNKFSSIIFNNTEKDPYMIGGEQGKNLLVNDGQRSIELYEDNIPVKNRSIPPDYIRNIANMKILIKTIDPTYKDTAPKVPNQETIITTEEATPTTSGFVIPGDIPANEFDGVDVNEFNDVPDIDGCPN